MNSMGCLEFFSSLLQNGQGFYIYICILIQLKILLPLCIWVEVHTIPNFIIDDDKNLNFVLIKIYFDHLQMF